MSKAGILLIALGLFIGLVAVWRALAPAQPAASPLEGISRLCEEALGKVEDHSLQEVTSVRIAPAANCFGPIVKFPRTWKRWIFQEVGQTRAESWLSGWQDGTDKPLAPKRSPELATWPSEGKAMRFAGRGTYLAIPIEQMEPSTNANEQIVIHVGGGQIWTDTGVALRVGDTVTVVGVGLMKLMPESHVPRVPAMSPAGYQPDCASANQQFDTSTVNPLKDVPLPTAPCWSLIGRMGDSGPVFEVGQVHVIRVTEAGELYLGVNEGQAGDTSGEWAVTLVTNPTTMPTMHSAYENRICEGANDGEANAVFVDHSQDNLRSFTIDLQPGCFSGYVLLPNSWNSYLMEPDEQLDGWWMAYKWYQSRNSGAGERPPLTPVDLRAVGQHTSLRIRLQGFGRLRIRLR